MGDAEPRGVVLDEGAVKTLPRCPCPENANRRHKSASPHPFERRRDRQPGPGPRQGLVPGLALGVYANIVAASHHLDLIPVLVFGIAPHLAILAGIGQLAPRTVPLFD